MTDTLFAAIGGVVATLVVVGFHRWRAGREGWPAGSSVGVADIIRLERLRLEAVVLWGVSALLAVFAVAQAGTHRVGFDAGATSCVEWRRLVPVVDSLARAVRDWPFPSPVPRPEP